MTKGADKAAAGGERLPLSAQLCIVFGFLSILAGAVVWNFYGTGGLLGNVDPNEIAHFRTAKVMLVPAMLLECCYLISSRSRFFGVRLRGTEMSCFILVEYTVKMICYSAMAHFDGGIVHLNSRSRGDPRGTYTFRYIEWSIAVPTLVAMNNYPLWSDGCHDAMARRLWPNLFATVSYVFGNWVAQVTPCDGLGCALIALTCCAYICTAVDQARVLFTADRGLMGFNFKVGAIVVKEAVFILYAAMNLMGIMNLVSSETEQLFYTVGDVLLKVMQAAILVVVRNWESLSELSDALQRRVEAGREDMSRLFRHASAPIFAMTPAGVVVAWNEHLARVSGVPEQVAIGTSVFDLVSEESLAGLRAAIASCGTGVSSGDVEISLKDGAVDDQPVQMLLTLIAQRSGGAHTGCCSSVLQTETQMITAIGQDLTEVMAMKEMQLRKTRITAVLGHELRSPLHGIMGLSGSMAESTSNPMQKRQLTMIKGCAARMLDLVTNLMEMAKLEKSDKSEAEVIEKRHVNMMDIVDEVVGMTEMAVDKNGRHLVNSNVMMINSMCAGKLPMVLGDSYKITQLLYNLVTNAAKFTMAGSIQISAREDEAEGALDIDVADTGKGIQDEALANIFEPFRQEENKDSRGFQGIGLGLSVAIGIAEAHGGSIKVASKVGQGSTFTVRLPCDFDRRAGLTLRSEDGTGAAKSRAAKQIAAQSQGAAPPGGVEPPVGQRPLVLSVDDDDINQEVIEQSLGSVYRIVRAMNGNEAFEYLESGKEFPSMMLLDVMMPGPSGFEVVAQIRNQRNLSHSQLPVVMLSARSPQEATASEAFRCGATDYMQKPFCSVVLKHRLNVMEEVRQEIRKAQVLAVEHYKSELQRSPSSGRGDAEPKRSAAEGQQGETSDNAGDAAAGGACDDAAARVRQLEAERDAFRSRLEAEERAARAMQGERDDYRSRFEALERQASLDARRLAEERDRLRAELGAMATPRPGRKLSDAAESESARLLSSGDGESEATLAFYREEVVLRDERIRDLRLKADRSKGDAWLAAYRAEAMSRELRFVRELGRARELAQ